MWFKPLALTLLQLSLVAAAPLDWENRRALPTPVSVATARNRRDLFPHWIPISGTCNTRETVLKRDGVNVVTNSACAAISGTWKSAYDGATWTAASDLDIDHLVPLKEAWVSGARSWTTARRQSFANDLTRPQLIAVTDNVNQAKGDKDPAEWMPPLASYHCTYVRAWITVKHYYELTIDSDEKSALTSYLDNC